MALRELADRSASLDIYIWLAYRFTLSTAQHPCAGLPYATSSACSMTTSGFSAETSARH